MVPGLVIAVQHADRKCRRHALCRAAKAAADNSGEFPQAVALFLTYATYFFNLVNEKIFVETKFIKIFFGVVIRFEKIFQWIFSIVKVKIVFFCSNIAGSYLDITEKSKKGVYSGVIECCSTSDKGIYKKCMYSRLLITKFVTNISNTFVHTYRIVEINAHQK